MGSQARSSVGPRLLRPMVVLLGVVVGSAIGYRLIEGWTFLDSLYMSVMTVGTVGFGEVHPLSAEGRLFTIVVIVVGLATLWYALSSLVSVVVEGQLTRDWERRRMERRLDRMSGHQILCGFGRVGRQIGEELRREGREVVVVDASPTVVTEATALGLLTVLGNATEDDALLSAGIARAAGLITAVASDADNVFVTLSARALRVDLPIVARANFDGVIPKLRRAGATQVVSPYASAGRQMARLALRPATVDFIETLLRGTNAELLLEDVRVAAGSPLVGLSIAEARLRLPSALLVAVRREGQMLAPLPLDLILRTDDVLAAVGRAEDLKQLEGASLASN